MASYRLRELKIEVNRDCPLHCLHCSSNGVPYAPECLDPSKISELIKEFAALGGEKVCFSGGEPLCFDGLPSALRAAQSENLDISLYTTGIVRSGRTLQPLSEKLAACLAEHGVKAVFSIHGACPETHEKLTGVKGSFDGTVAAIERVICAGVKPELHVVPTAVNFHELAAITELANSLGIARVSWLRFVPQGRGLNNRSALQLSTEQLQKLVTRKDELRQVYPDVAIRTGAPFNILCPDISASCEAGKSILTIGPDGTASPCDAFKRFGARDDVGNVLQHSLAEVWEKSLFLNAVRTLNESGRNSSCEACRLYSRCGSGCLAQKAIAAGMLAQGRDPDCPLRAVEVFSDEFQAVAV